MNIKEIIRAEIERLIDEYTDIAIDSHYGTVNANHVVADLEQLVSFIDTLPEQPVEGLEKEIYKCAKSDLCPEDLTYSEFATIARHFYELGLNERKEK